MFILNGLFFFFLKLDIDGQIDSIHLFLSPRQVHLLLDMLAAIAGPGKYDNRQLCYYFYLKLFRFCDS